MTFRDRTQRFQELRRLYKPHSIKIKDISSYLRSAASNISHRTNAKFSKSKLAQKLGIKDPYNSDDSEEGKSLLKHTSTRHNQNNSNSYSDSDDSSSSSENEQKLPKNLLQSLQTEPIWLQLLHDIDAIISNIKNQLGILKQTHRERLRIQFDDELYVSQDIQIEECTKSITSLFHNTQNRLKQIAIKSQNKNGTHTLDRTEYELRLNAMKSRAVKIQKLTTIFRFDQRVFLEQLRERESKGSKYIKPHNSGMDGSGFGRLNLDLSKIEQGLTKQELIALEAMENTCDQRTKEIINISKSVSELAQIFKDLSVLIVEQGSVLDRIDYNVEQSLDRFKSSKKHIDSAETYQKKSTSSVVILFLLMVIAVCVLILILQRVV